MFRLEFEPPTHRKVFLSFKFYCFIHIYKITNILNNIIYVGKEKGNNPDYFGSGKIINYAIIKYGKENFKKEILQKCCSHNCMNDAERFWIKILKSQNRNIGYNISEGGDWGYCGSKIQFKRSQSGGKALSVRLKNDKELFKKWSKRSSNNMKKLHQEHKINYATFTGKKHSQESKNKMRNSKIGRYVGEKNSQYGTCWIYNLNLKISKKIKKEDLDLFIQNQWKIGRKIKFNEFISS